MERKGSELKEGGRSHRTEEAEPDKPVFTLGSATSLPGNLGQAALSRQAPGYLSRGLIISPPREIARSISDHRCTHVFI